VTAIDSHLPYRTDAHGELRAEAALAKNRLDRVVVMERGADRSAQYEVKAKMAALTNGVSRG
jgi:hypothetical protein